MTSMHAQGPAQPTSLVGRANWLDFLSKGVWPVATLAVATMGLLFNTKSERRIRQLEEEVGSQRRLTSQAEGQAQRLRERVAFELASTPEHDVAVRARLALLSAALKAVDAGPLGEERAEELWKKAEDKAKKRPECAR
jgi:hypothetical protein